LCTPGVHLNLQFAVSFHCVFIQFISVLRNVCKCADANLRADSRYIANEQYPPFPQLKIVSREKCVTVKEFLACYNHTFSLKSVAKSQSFTTSRKKTQKGSKKLVIGMLAWFNSTGNKILWLPFPTPVVTGCALPWADRAYDWLQLNRSVLCLYHTCPRTRSPCWFCKCCQLAYEFLWLASRLATV